MRAARLTPAGQAEGLEAGSAQVSLRQNFPPQAQGSAPQAPGSPPSPNQRTEPRVPSAIR